jgi:ATP-dependent helicase/nuclease subunit A
MGKGTLKIYSASAGSGKTYKLTGIYLANLFKSRYSYRRILAVTFTNKATAEMKSRILENLHRLAKGEPSDYLEGLKKTTEREESWLRQEAGEILNSILHDFSRFSVSTIDSFFQKVLRSFAREAGLHSGFNIEIDHTVILSEAIDEMIASAAKDEQLKNWLITYAISNIDEEKSWNLKDGITRLAEELFKEKYKILSEEERSLLENKNFLLSYIDRIRTIRSDFESSLRTYGARTMKLFSDYGLSDEMFYQKGRGIPGFIRNLAVGKITNPNTYVREITGENPRWSSSAIDPHLESAIDNGLETTLKDAVNYYDHGIRSYNTAVAILSNIYALGILSDVLQNVRVLANAGNSFLLSDAGEVLHLITKTDQSPFIYEKIGTKFENFMIDEFQDTSRIQWNNFSHLVDNSMAEGFDNLVVGDVKQSIYRWRNSDWRILGQELAEMIDGDRFLSEPLAVNWRSRSNIIEFNNELFTIIPGIIDNDLNQYSLPVSFKKLYSEAQQTDPGRKPGGYVKISFIDDSKENSWKDVVAAELPVIIESVQDNGFKASDIGIIVRDSREGAFILKSLVTYANNCPSDKKEHYNYNIVSNDSLLLSNSPVICFIISVLKVVNENCDMISRAAMLRFYLLSRGDKNSDSVSLMVDTIERVSTGIFPAGYETLLESIGQLTVFEAIEHVIGFFGLGSFQHNMAYLNTFQDYVIGFAGSGNSDIPAFIEWWETTGVRKSVVLPANEDAMRILTIHKSKGLEFKVVIVPFISWDLDHPPHSHPFLWIKPDVEPFNELGIVPVKYGKDITETIFESSYNEEKYSVYLDNINLLYVAFTRAKDVILGFAPDKQGTDNTISGVLKRAFLSDTADLEKNNFELIRGFDREKMFLEVGEMPFNIDENVEKNGLPVNRYTVNHNMGSLKLKLHGENYFSAERKAVRERINYGKLMHEVFEGINRVEDIAPAIRKLVLEGKLPENESYALNERITGLISDPGVADWFKPDNEVFTEAAILLKTGETRRPDRVIFRNGKTVVVDFKFGEEHDRYADQVNHYRRLLGDMGYDNIEAYIWYVDRNKIVSV